VCSYDLIGFKEGRSLNSFDEWEYLASNTDVLTGLGASATAAAQHYAQHGFKESRTLDTFNEWEYVASNMSRMQNSDIIDRVNKSVSNAAYQYCKDGYWEGYSLSSFNGAAYLNANPDIISVQGSDLTLAARHYVLYGSIEGRSLA
jgi:serralysin